jgi:hypothetical protein
MRWVIGGLALLGLVNLVLGFAFDKDSTENWDVFGIFLGVGLATATALGMIYVVSDYVVGMMLASLGIWAVATTHHVLEHSSTRNWVHA